MAICRKDFPRRTTERKFLFIKTPSAGAKIEHSHTCCRISIEFVMHGLEFVFMTLEMTLEFNQHTSNFVFH